MRHQDRRDPRFPLDPPDLVAQLHPHLGIQRRKRLVEQQHVRLHRQRSRPAPRAAAARPKVGAGISASGCRGPPGRATRVARASCSGFGRPATRGPNRTLSSAVMLEEQAVGLEHHAHPPRARRQRRHVAPRDQHAAMIWVDEPRHDPQQRRLAAPARPQQANQLAIHHGQIEPGQHLPARIALSHVPRLDRRHFTALPRSVPAHARPAARPSIAPQVIRKLTTDSAAASVASCCPIWLMNTA